MAPGRDQGQLQPVAFESLLTARRGPSRAASRAGPCQHELGMDFVGSARDCRREVLRRAEGANVPLAIHGDMLLER